MIGRNVYYSFVIICFTICFIECGTHYQKDRSSIQHVYNVPDPKKRPFCNAFTGCGRKRADTSIPQTNSESEENSANGIDDTLGDLLDLNSEPAVEDLMRQIMSQAKLWEAIQEANREMTIQKNDRNIREKFPSLAFNSQ